MVFSMYVIHSSFGNDSLALIQWAYEHQLEDVTVCYIDTGWAAEGWLRHVEQCEQFVRERGFDSVRLTSRASFERLMIIKNGFPAGKYQWCGLHLKGITLLQWLDEIDPSASATVLYGKRRQVSRQLDPINEFIEQSEHHGERRVWYPLYAHSTEQRDALLSRTGLVPLPYHSRQCYPCINTPWSELRDISEADIAKTEELEEELGAALFADRLPHEANDIRTVIRMVRDRTELDQEDVRFGCSAAFGCGE